MTTNPTKADGPDRRAVEPRSWPRPPGLALLALALFGLIQAGCKSDGCSTCGFGNSISNGLQAVGNGVKSVGSIFHHKKGCGGAVGGDCGCGGGGSEEGMVIDQGMPVMPGGMMIPAPTIVPAPSIDSEPTRLEAIPGTSPASPTSGTGTGTSTPSTKSTTSRSTPAGTSRSGYSTSLLRNGVAARKGSEADQALYSSSKAGSRATDPSGTSDLFENLPPVDLSSEVTRKAVASPAATNPSPIPTPTAATPAPAEKVSAADGGTLNLPPIASISSYQAPGLTRYASIAPSIAGGSAPSIEGLDWLKEKGYRTLLDLRKSSEVEPTFVDAVNDRGMVYISLPIVADRLDQSRLARFDDLISRTENRPLFFCDADGSRAALAWYIHERVVGQEDPHAALAKAEELGLGAAEMKRAEDYLATHKPKAKAAMAKVAMANPAPAPAAEPAPAPAAVASPPEVAPLALPETPSTPSRPAMAPATPPRSEGTNLPMLPGEERPQASTGPVPDYRDPAAWRPAAALVLTSIGVPLAFWSRTMLSEYRCVRKRASLPGRGPRSLDAPAGSDA